MKVVHLNTNDISGGAARAAYRLHQGLRGIGCVSSMFVLRRASKDPGVEAFEPPMDWPSRLRRRLRREVLQRRLAQYRKTRPAGREPFTPARTPFGRQVLRQLPQSDIVNLHWIRGFVDLPAFFADVTVPVVWTLHDMNAFTGGCHYDEGCGRYAAACGACPQLGSSKEEDLSRQVWARKKSACERLDPERFHIVAPSRWLAREARRSTLLGRFPVSVIPYGLGTTVFSPRDRAALRRSLGLPEAARVLLFVAQSTANRRKGFSLLAEAVGALDDVDGLHLLSVGSRRPEVPSEVPHLHLGEIENDRLLAVAYNAADVFVIPSLQDNLPNTVLEAIACGTPVVGFDAGGIPDMVRPGETGLLAPVGDVRALREAIRQVLKDDEKRTAMARRCRQVAVEEYALDVQARRYVELYEEMLASTSRSLSNGKSSEVRQGTVVPHM